MKNKNNNKHIILGLSVAVLLIVISILHVVPIDKYQPFNSCPTKLKHYSIIGGDLNNFRSEREQDLQSKSIYEQQREYARKHGLPIIQEGCRIGPTKGLYIF